MPKKIQRPAPSSRQPSDDARRESGQPGGGAGRREEVGPTGVYPMSGGIPEGKHLEIRNPAAWGQGERGADGYNDAGGSELVMRDGRVLGGLTSGPGGEPTIDIHGGDMPSSHPHAGVASEHRRGRFYGVGPKGYRRSDERIHEEISDRLMTHPDIDASDIEVVVANGIVTLTGTAEDRHEKRLANLIAEDVVGVDDVQNQLKVRHGFWAAVTGERATEREMPRRAERGEIVVAADRSLIHRDQPRDATSPGSASSGDSLPSAPGATPRARRP